MSLRNIYLILKIYTNPLKFNNILLPPRYTKNGHGILKFNQFPERIIISFRKRCVSWKKRGRRTKKKIFSVSCLDVKNTHGKLSVRLLLLTKADRKSLRRILGHADRNRFLFFLFPFSTTRNGIFRPLCKRGWFHCYADSRPPLCPGKLCANSRGTFLVTISIHRDNARARFYI